MSFAQRIARGQSPHFHTGTGTGQPLGITAATVGATTASPTAISLADLAALVQSVDSFDFNLYGPTALEWAKLIEHEGLKAGLKNRDMEFDPEMSKI